MDELCEYLSDIPAADISALFGPSASFVQKRLALRYSIHKNDVIIYFLHSAVCVQYMYVYVGDVYI